MTGRVNVAPLEGRVSRADPRQQGGCVLPGGLVCFWDGKTGNTQIRKRPKYAEIPKNTEPSRREAPLKFSDSTVS